MFTELLRAWSVVPGILSAIWYGALNAGRHGLNPGRKIFLLHYRAHATAIPVGIAQPAYARCKQQKSGKDL